MQEVSVFLFRHSHALQHQHDRPAGGTNIDGLVGRVQHQHRRVQRVAVAFAMRSFPVHPHAAGVGPWPLSIEPFIELFHFPDILFTRRATRPRRAYPVAATVRSPSARPVRQINSLRVGLQRASYRSDKYFRCARPPQNARAFRGGGAGGEYIVHQQDFAAGDFLRPGHRKEPRRFSRR